MESALQHIVYIARDFSALLSCGINDILIVTSTEAKRSRPIDLILINLTQIFNISNDNRRATTT